MISDKFSGGNFEKALMSAVQQQVKVAQNSARSENASLGQSEVSGNVALNGASVPSGESPVQPGGSSILGSVFNALF